MFSSHAAYVISLPSRRRCNRQRGSRQRYYKPKRRSGIMRLTVVMVVVLLYVTSGVETRSVRETCNRLVEPPTCNNYCNDVLYYLSPKSGQCELCIECPAGQEPNHPDPCTAQAKNESVTCIGCDDTISFSNQKDQHHCQPCQVCLNRLIAGECSPTSDRVCGDCKPGFFSKTYDDDEYCVPCTKARTDEDREKCQTTTVDPTTTPMPTTTMKMPMTKKFKSPLPAPKITVVTTDEVNHPDNPPAHVIPVISGAEDDKKLTELTILCLCIVGCIFVVLICVICAFVYIKRSTGSRRPSVDSKGSRVSYSKAPAEDNGDNYPGGDSNTTLKPVPCVTFLNDKSVPITSANLQVNDVRKEISTKEIHIVPNMTADRMEVQRSPNDGKVGSTVTESEISSTSEVSSTDILSHDGNQLTIASKPKAAVNKIQNVETKPMRRLHRALSVPEIRVSSNQLIGLMKEHAHCLGSPKPIASDISSGDESDQGLTALPEDAILLQKSRRKSVSSLAVPVKKPPSRVRRKSSSGTVSPLLTDGGSFSSGTSKDYFPSDSQHSSSTSSIINNNNVFSAPRSLHSYQTPPEQRKKKKHVRRQLSHENQAMDTSDNGELSDKNTQMCQRSKGPVAQPSQVDDPVPYRASYHTVFSQYQYQHEEQQPYGFNQSQQLPPQQTTANSSPMPMTLPQTPTALPPSTSHSSATPIRAPPTGTTPTGHVVQHIYQGTVIQSVKGNNLNISVGDNNNLIQQGTHRGDCGGTGGSSGFQPIPRTPEPVDCTEQDEELVKCDFSSSTRDGSS